MSAIIFFTAVSVSKLFLALALMIAIVRVFIGPRASWQQLPSPSSLCEGR